jgi:hypothetical protein
MYMQGQKRDGAASTARPVDTRLEVYVSARDFRGVAAVVKAVLDTGGDAGTLVALVIRLGTVFGEDNPRYDHEKFVAACGLDPEVAA